MPVNTFSLAIGPESGFTSVNNTVMFQFGGSAHLQYQISRKFAATLTSGYYTFSYIHLDDARPYGSTAPYGPDFNFQMVPVKAGLKYYYILGGYCELEAGAGFANKLESGTKLLVSPGAGYSLRRWDFNVRYENFSGQGINTGMIAINCCYKFNFSK